jgi:hypothetical protein
MITLELESIPTLFIKAFATEDVSTILEFVREARSKRNVPDNTVLFIDTPITVAIVESVERLTTEGYRVVFRDHHGLDGEPSNDREQRVVLSTARLRQLLSDDCTITMRRLHPACSSLVTTGEFKDAVAIIADPDADGLTAAMKAAGIWYPDLDDDAAKLDSQPSVQVTGSPISQLLYKGLAILPSYDTENPHLREKAQESVFRDWVAAVKGDSKALTKLQEGTKDYDRAVQVARDLAQAAKAIAPGVMLVDVIGAPTFDAGTLTVLLEEMPSCRIAVIRKDRGPIAAIHGVQYSMSVVKQYQKSIDLQQLVPSSAKNSLQAGIVSNVSFLLHVSEDVWREHVLPGLG